MRVAGGRNQAEADLIQGLLPRRGSAEHLRRTAGFDVPDFLAARAADVARADRRSQDAREVLLEADHGAHHRRAPAQPPGRCCSPPLIALGAEPPRSAGRLARLPGRLSGNER